MKTGECYFRKENGDLWLAESFINDNGLVISTEVFIELADIIVIE